MQSNDGFPSYDYIEPKVDADLYYEIELVPTGFTYDIIGPIHSYEITNADYVEKVNKTVDSFDKEKPTYPTGSTFVNTGKYEALE